MGSTKGDFPQAAFPSGETYRSTLCDSKGHKGIVEYLCEAKADVNIKNDMSETALDIAMEEGHDGIADVLKEAGASADDDFGEEGGGTVK